MDTPKFAGTYTTADFTLISDGQGGTDVLHSPVIDPPAALAEALHGTAPVHGAFSLDWHENRPGDFTTHALAHDGSRVR